MRVVASSVARLPGRRPLLTLTLTDSRGSFGRGDAAPLPGFSPENADECEDALRGLHEPLGELPDSVTPVVAVQMALAPLADGLDRTPSARLAVEVALFDLVATDRRLSVAECLGGTPPASAIPINGLLYAHPEATLADRAVALARRGYGAIKIKLRAATDGGFDRELDALLETRRCLPHPFELRVDWNAALSLDVAPRRLERLAPLGLRYVEQPVAPAELARIDSRGVPWAADESLVSPGDIEALLAAPGCAAFVLKPALHGGLLRARALATVAAGHGIGVVVTHLFDGPRAMAAAAELAASLPIPPLACGLDRHADLAAWEAAAGGYQVPQLDLPARVRSSGGPGLRVLAANEVGRGVGDG